MMIYKPFFPRPDTGPVTQEELIEVLKLARKRVNSPWFDAGVCLAIKSASAEIAQRGCPRWLEMTEETNRLSKGIQWWFREWFSPSKDVGCSVYWWSPPHSNFSTVNERKLPRAIALDLAILIAERGPE